MNDYDITFCDNAECYKHKDCHRWQMYQRFKADKPINKPLYIMIYKGNHHGCKMFLKYKTI